MQRCSCQRGSRTRRTKPAPLERRHVRRLVAGVGDGQVDVDDRLGGEIRDARRAHVLESEDPVAKGAADAVGQHLELRRPRRIGIDHGDRLRGRAFADPDVLVQVSVLVPRDPLERRHTSSLRMGTTEEFLRCAHSMSHRR